MCCAHGTCLQLAEAAAQGLLLNLSAQRRPPRTFSVFA
jgi:hypothetical protein